MPALTAIGRVVRLQVQRSSLKVGPPQGTPYAPGPIMPVPALRIGPDGVLGWPSTASRSSTSTIAATRARRTATTNGVSIGFTSHYAAMRARFGAAPGRRDRRREHPGRDRARLPADDLSGTLLIGRTRLGELQSAEPCEPFSRFALAGPARRADRSGGSSRRCASCGTARAATTAPARLEARRAGRRPRLPGLRGEPAPLGRRLRARPERWSRPPSLPARPARRAASARARSAAPGRPPARGGQDQVADRGSGSATRAAGRAQPVAVASSFRTTASAATSATASPSSPSARAAVR